jgi:hypothetical protein
MGQAYRDEMDALHSSPTSGGPVSSGTTVG